jgi:hypothetical protein
MKNLKKMRKRTMWTQVMEVKKKKMRRRRRRRRSRWKK